MSLNQTKYVAVYSNDIHLVESVEGDSFLCYEKTEQTVEYDLKNTTSDVESLSASDAVIYDLDLAGNDEASVIEDILHLKLNSRFKPLILVGNKDLLKQLMGSDKIEPHVAKSIAKPINQSRLRFVVDAIIAKQMVMTPPVKQPNSALKLVAVGSLATACLGASLAFVLLNNEDANASIEVASMSQTFEQHTIGVQINSNDAAPEKVSADVQWLSEQASTAMAEKRLAYPEKHSALYYYDQILAADLYNTSAYEGRKQVLGQLRESLAGLISSGEMQTASKVVDALVAAEPFRDDNRDLLALIAPAKKSAKPVKQKPVSSAKSNNVASSAATKVSTVKNSKVKQPATLLPPTRVASSKPVQQAAVKAVESTNKKVIQEPVIMKSVGPRYPKKAMRNNIEGWIEVAYQVDQAGKPINVQVVNAQPEKVFDKSGIRAIKEWKFEPAVDSKTGRPVISEQTTTTFRFNLNT